MRKVNPIALKIPRGVIYHSLAQSVAYFIRSLWMPLDNRIKVREFEAAFASYCDRKHATAFPFARTAIYYVLRTLNLPKGSEVVMPPITIKGILDVVLELGLLPRYVELDADTMCFSLDDLRHKIGPTSRAVILTPLFGLVPDMEAMMRIFRENKLFVIEDFSQCLNGRFGGKRIGTFGDVGIYSSSSIKTLDTLGGGIAVMDDEHLYESLCDAQEGLLKPSRKFLLKKTLVNLIRNFATLQPWFSLLTFPMLQLIRSHDPEVALKQTGHRDKARLAKLPEQWFCRYTSVQAIIGLENLGKVVTDDASRVANAEFLKSRSGVERYPATTKLSANVYWQLIMLSPNALVAQSFFASGGVDIATSSLELISRLKDYPNQEELPVATQIHSNGIFIPCYPKLNHGNMVRVAKLVREFFDEND